MTIDILLVGDSIIDNHHWHSPRVGRDCTGDVLHELAIPHDILVHNHAVEETRAKEWYDDYGNVDLNASKRPNDVYVKSAREDHVKTSYPGLISELYPRLYNGIEFFPRIDSDKLTVVVSALGNDLFLGGEWSSLIFSPSTLIERLNKIFKAYKLRYGGCRVIYVFPYKPAKIYGIDTEGGITGYLFNLRLQSMKESIKALESIDGIIDLSEEFEHPLHFEDSGTGIPEPTKVGARKLAELILSKALDN